MFKIFATVIMLAAGQPSGDPQHLTSRPSFPTLEACEAVRTSQDTSVASEAGLKASVEAQGLDAQVSTECRKIDDSDAE